MITGGVFDNVDDEYGTNMGIRNNDTLFYWVRPLLNVRKQELVRYLQLAAEQFHMAKGYQQPIQQIFTQSYP